MAKEEEEIGIIDESGDREFFTIIPNYILNHSSAVDQALYLQMKRLTGESGKCFASRAHLMKQLGIGKDALIESMKYLLKNKWISVVEGEMRGKTKSIPVYRVNNIWKINSIHYQEARSRSARLVAKQGLNPPAKLGLDPPRKKELVLSKNNTNNTNSILSKTLSEQTSDKVLHKASCELIDYFKKQHYELISDTQLQINFASWVKKAKPFVKELGLNRMKVLADEYFDSNDDFFQKHKWAINCFLSEYRINQLNQSIPKT